MPLYQYIFSGLPRSGVTQCQTLRIFGCSDDTGGRTKDRMLCQLTRPIFTVHHCQIQSAHPLVEYTSTEHLLRDCREPIELKCREATHQGNYYLLEGNCPLWYMAFATLRTVLGLVFSWVAGAKSVRASSRHGNGVWDSAAITGILSQIYIPILTEWTGFRSCRPSIRV
jgi:hypothetical protein